MATNTTGGKKTCKVGTAKMKYGLDEIDEELLRRYEEEDQSFRQLERFFNIRILQVAANREGYDYLDGELENLRRLLRQEGDVPESVSNDARNRLKDAGINVDEVESDFVSYNTIGTHLKECKGIKPEDKKKEPTLDDGYNTVAALVSRTKAVINKTVERLEKADKMHIGDFDVTAPRIECNECGRSHDILRLFNNGGCTCSIPSEQESEQTA